jgi:putative mRNA 3-end processing factor
MEIKILGAAKEVGRSAFLVSNEKSNILLDYGVLLKKEPQFPLHVKPKDLNSRPFRPFRISPFFIFILH